jgi:hypothetical protein
MSTVKECLAFGLIAALSVLSVASPVAAHDHGWGPRTEPVNVMNKTTNPVPVAVQGTQNVTVTNKPTVVIDNTQPLKVTGIVVTGGTGGGGAPAPEVGAQFVKDGSTLAMLTTTELGLSTDPGRQRFVIDFLSVDVGLTQTDCSLMQVRVDDGASEFARAVLKLHGNPNGFWGASQSVKMYVDAGQRILAIPFPGCENTSTRLSVVGHYAP